MKTTFNGRPVEITEINHGRSDPVDSFIETAHYLDGDEEELTEEECQELTDETDFHEEWYENKMCEAEYYADRD